MRCHKQSLAGEIHQMQLPQQLGRPELFWQLEPYPPQAMFNPWMAASQYPTAGPSPPSQLLSQVPSLGEQRFWFQALVTAVSKEIKNDTEKKAAAGDVDERMAAPADLPTEDEKTLIDALKKHNEGGLTMQQVFEELSQKNGHPEIMWKTWFIANFEKLNSKVAFNPNVERASAGGTTRFTGLGSQGTSRTRSTSSNRPSRSSTIIVTDERSNSREESGSGWEWEELSDDQGSTSHDPGRSASRNAPQPRATTNSNVNTAAPTSARPARARRQPLRVTDADLRAMALYRFEKGDDCKVRRYSYPHWREFAQRPENRKRTLAAWTCIPRVARHAAAIEQYLKACQLLAEAEVVESKTVLSSPGAEKQLPVVTAVQNGDSEHIKREIRAVDPEDVIDLTIETEE